MSPQTDLEGERLATQEKLGKLKQMYRPGYVYLIGMITTTIFWLAMIILAIITNIAGAFPYPAWAVLLGILVGILMLVILIALTITSYHKRLRRILLYERGLIDITSRGMQVARWDQIRYVWHWVTTQYAGTLGFAIHVTYTIQTIHGVSLSFDNNIARQDELIKSLDQQIIPDLLLQARRGYQAGQEVDFDHLVLSKAGLKTKDGSKTLPWSEVASVKAASELKIKQKGKNLSWFDRAIPNMQVCETLMREILEGQSTMTPPEV